MNINQLQSRKTKFNHSVPLEIENLIHGKRWKVSKVGMSGSQVYLSKDIVLKVSDVNVETTNEILNYQSLQSLDFIPRLHGFALDERYNYLIIHRIKGNMLGENPHDNIFEVLKQVYTAITKTKISNTMIDQSLNCRLQSAEENVKKGLVDMNSWDTNFHNEHFESPEKLLEYLKRNKPNLQQNCFSHGDLCFENIIVNHGKFSHLIDLGRTGLADPYQDLALMIRSACYHFERDITDELEKVLEINIDRSRLNYYMLLDELF